MAPATGTLPVFTLSSRVFGGAKVLQLYQEATGAVFSARPDGIVSASDFHADLRATHLGCLVMTEADMSAQRFERSRRMVAATGTDHIYVVLYSEGGSAGTADGRDYRVRAGDISFLDLSRPRETRSDAFRNVTLVIPRALLEEQGADVDAMHGLVLKRDLPLTAMLAAHLRALVLHARRLSLAEAETMGMATVALIASLTGRGTAGAGRVPPSPRRQMTRFIDANLGDPGLGPARLMAEFGVSRAALYRMFDQEGGVAEVIRMRRLAEAAMTLGSAGGAERRISEVARRLGFADVSGFSRAFRARYGIAPTEARNQSSAFWATARDADRDADLGRWVRMLRG